MTMAELAARVTALEQAVEELKHRRLPAPGQQRHWWREDAGRFKDDPEFVEIVRLGREYRESLRPGQRKATTAKQMKKDVNS